MKYELFIFFLASYVSYSDKSCSLDTSNGAYQIFDTTGVWDVKEGSHIYDYSNSVSQCETVCNKDALCTAFDIDAIDNKQCRLYSYITPVDNVGWECFQKSKYFVFCRYCDFLQNVLQFSCTSLFFQDFITFFVCSLLGFKTMS